MLPSDEALHQDRLSRLQIEDRLIFGEKLITVHRSLQLGPQLNPLDRFLMGVGLKDLVAGLAPCLGQLGGHISIPHQLFQANRAFVIERHTNRNRSSDSPVSNLNRGLHGLQEATGDSRRSRPLTNTGKEDGEVVTTQATDQVIRAHTRLNPLGRLKENLVARIVAQRIVCLLQTIDVNHQHRSHALSCGSSTADQSQLALFQKGRTVGQSGHRIPLIAETDLFVAPVNRRPQCIEAPADEAGDGNGG